MREEIAYNDIWKKFRRKNLVIKNLAEWFRGREFVTLCIKLNSSELNTALKIIKNDFVEFQDVDFHNFDYFHITLKKMGFLVRTKSSYYEITAKDLDKIMKKLDNVLSNYQAFNIKVGKLNMFSDTIFFETYPITFLAKLHNIIKNGVQEIPPFQFEGDKFIPHISIAKFNNNTNTYELVKVISKIRKVPLNIDVEVNKISLIKAIFKDDKISFREIKTYPLTNL